MMPHHPLAVALLVLLVAGPAVAAIDTSYLEDHARTRGFMLGRPVRPKFTPDGKFVLFLRAEARKARMSLYEFDVATGKTRELLSPEKLLAGAEEKLTPEEKARRERQRVTLGGFTTYQLSKDGERLLLSLSGRLYLVDRATAKPTELRTGKGTLVDPKFSPDGKLVSYVLDHDVYVLDPATQKETRVTPGGTEAKPYGLAEFVAQEEMGRFTGYWWSPDGKSIACQHSDHEGVENWYVADPAHPDRQGHPSFYPRPGKKNVRVSLAIFPASGGGKPVWVKWNPEKFPYVARVDWQRGGLSLLVQDRAQQEQILLWVSNPKTGDTLPMHAEKDPAWLTLNRDKPHWLDDGAFVWHCNSEKGPTLEIRYTNSPNESYTMVDEKQGFRSLLRYDYDSRSYWFLASPDPTQQHVWRGKNREKPVKLSDGDGIHTAEVADTGHFVLTSSTPGAMPRSTVHAPDGKKLGELPSGAEEPPLKVNQTIAKVGDFYTAVIRPTDFDAKAKYPVIVHVYGGPGHQEVLAQMNRRLIDQWIADRGFIVVAIDGRGTPGRGRDWERATYKKFGSMALADQVAGVKALVAKHPEMDGNRVGVYGWSFGGYMSAMAALREPKVFKAAIAGAPVTDWHDYDTHYTERYMGVPGKDDPDYARESLLSPVKGDISPLLLVHGTADDNVYFRHSLRLADSLFRQGHEFDVLPLSGLTHQLPDPVVTQRLYARFVSFFRKHLGSPAKERP